MAEKWEDSINKKSQSIQSLPAIEQKISDLSNSIPLFEDEKTLEEGKLQDIEAVILDIKGQITVLNDNKTLLEQKIADLTKQEEEKEAELDTFLPALLANLKSLKIELYNIVETMEPSLRAIKRTLEREMDEIKEIIFSKEEKEEITSEKEKELLEVELQQIEDNTEQEIKQIQEDLENKIQPNPEMERIKKILTDNGVPADKITFYEDLSVKVEHDFNFSKTGEYENVKEYPFNSFNIRKVVGDFYMNHPIIIQSVQRFPEIINGNFYCNYIDFPLLTPKVVEKDFTASSSDLAVSILDIAKNCLVKEYIILNDRNSIKFDYEKEGVIPPAITKEPRLLEIETELEEMIKLKNDILQNLDNELEKLTPENIEKECERLEEELPEMEKLIEDGRKASLISEEEIKQIQEDLENKIQPNPEMERIKKILTDNGVPADKITFYEDLSVKVEHDFNFSKTGEYENVKEYPFNSFNIRKVVGDFVFKEVVGDFVFKNVKKFPEIITGNFIIGDAKISMVESKALPKIVEKNFIVTDNVSDMRLETIVKNCWVKGEIIINETGGSKVFYNISYKNIWDPITKTLTIYETGEIRLPAGLPRVEKLICPDNIRGIWVNNNPELKYLEAPFTREVNTEETSVGHLDLPNAEIIYAMKSPLLTLNAPKAYTIRVEECDSLCNINTKSGLNIKNFIENPASSGNYIPRFNIPFAHQWDPASKTLTIYEEGAIRLPAGLPGVKRLICPDNVVGVWVHKNPALIYLEAPITYEVNTDETSVGNLDLPRARKVYALKSSLETLNAPRAIEVRVENYLLASLKAESGISIIGFRESQEESGIYMASYNIPYKNIWDPITKTLTIYEEGAIKLPKKLTNVEKVICPDNITGIWLNNNPELKYLEAPITREVNTDETSVAHLDLPNAEIVYALKSRLQTLNAPKAYTVRVEGSYLVVSIQAKSGISIIGFREREETPGRYAPVLTSLANIKYGWDVFDNTLTIYEEGEVRLPKKLRGVEKLVCPDNISGIWVNNNPELKYLEAPITREVNTEETSVAHLDLPNAEMIYAIKSLLETLNAPNAHTVRVEGCHALTSIKAKSGISIIGFSESKEESGYYTRSYNIPYKHIWEPITKTLTIYEEGEIRLPRALPGVEKLVCPDNISGIWVNNNPELKYLEAPITREVNTEETSVAHLDLPNAEMIYAIKSLLETLNAPNAHTVRVEGCYLLVLLEAKSGISIIGFSESNEGSGYYTQFNSIKRLKFDYQIEDMERIVLPEELPFIIDPSDEKEIDKIKKEAEKLINDLSLNIIHESSNKDIALEILTNKKKALTKLSEETEASLQDTTETLREVERIKKILTDNGVPADKITFYEDLSVKVEHDFNFSKTGEYENVKEYPFNSFNIRKVVGDFYMNHPIIIQSVQRFPEIINGNFYIENFFSRNISSYKINDNPLPKLVEGNMMVFDVILSKLLIKLIVKNCMVEGYIILPGALREKFDYMKEGIIPPALSPEPSIISDPSNEFYTQKITDEQNEIMTTLRQTAKSISDDIKSFIVEGSQDARKADSSPVMQQFNLQQVNDATQINDGPAVTVISGESFSSPIPSDETRLTQYIIDAPLLMDRAEVLSSTLAKLLKYEIVNKNTISEGVNDIMIDNILSQEFAKLGYNAYYPAFVAKDLTLLRHGLNMQDKLLDGIEEPKADDNISIFIQNPVLFLSNYVITGSSKTWDYLPSPNYLSLLKVDEGYKAAYTTKMEKSISAYFLSSTILEQANNLFPTSIVIPQNPDVNDPQVVMIGCIQGESIAVIPDNVNNTYTVYKDGKKGSSILYDNPIIKADYGDYANTEDSQSFGFAVMVYNADKWNLIIQRLKVEFNESGNEIAVFNNHFGEKNNIIILNPLQTNTHEDQIEAFYNAREELKIEALKLEQKIILLKQDWPQLPAGFNTATYPNLSYSHTWQPTSRTLTITAGNAVNVANNKMLYVKNLICPNAGKVEAQNNSTLEYINAPLANEVICFSTSVLELDLPGATALDCKKNPYLVSIKAPKVTRLDAMECNNLNRIIIAPGATSTLIASSIKESPANSGIYFSENRIADSSYNANAPMAGDSTPQYNYLIKKLMQYYESQLLIKNSFATDISLTEEIDITKEVERIKKSQATKEETDILSRTHLIGTFEILIENIKQNLKEIKNDLYSSDISNKSEIYSKAAEINHYFSILNKIEANNNIFFLLEQKKSLGKDSIIKNSFELLSKPELLRSQKSGLYLTKFISSLLFTWNNLLTESALTDSSNLLNNFSVPEYTLPQNLSSRNNNQNVVLYFTDGGKLMSGYKEVKKFLYSALQELILNPNTNITLSHIQSAIALLLKGGMEEIRKYMINYKKFQFEEIKGTFFNIPQNVINIYDAMDLISEDSLNALTGTGKGFFSTSAILAGAFVSSYPLAKNHVFKTLYDDTLELNGYLRTNLAGPAINVNHPAIKKLNSDQYIDLLDKAFINDKVYSQSGIEINNYTGINTPELAIDKLEAIPKPVNGELFSPNMFIYDISVTNNTIIHSNHKLLLGFNYIGVLDDNLQVTSYEKKYYLASLGKNLTTNQSKESIQDLLTSFFDKINPVYNVSGVLRQIDVEKLKNYSPALGYPTLKEFIENPGFSVEKSDFPNHVNSVSSSLMEEIPLELMIDSNKRNFDNVALSPMYKEIAIQGFDLNIQESLSCCQEAIKRISSRNTFKVQNIINQIRKISWDIGSELLKSPPIVHTGDLDINLANLEGALFTINSSYEEATRKIINTYNLDPSRKWVVSIDPDRPILPNQNKIASGKTKYGVMIYDSENENSIPTKGVTEDEIFYNLHSLLVDMPQESAFNMDQYWFPVELVNAININAIRAIKFAAEKFLTTQARSLGTRVNLASLYKKPPFTHYLKNALGGSAGGGPMRLHNAGMASAVTLAFALGLEIYSFVQVMQSGDQDQIMIGSVNFALSITSLIVGFIPIVGPILVVLIAVGQLIFNIFMKGHLENKYYRAVEDQLKERVKQIKESYEKKGYEVFTDGSNIKSLRPLGEVAFNNINFQTKQITFGETYVNASEKLNDIQEVYYFTNPIVKNSKINLREGWKYPKTGTFEGDVNIENVILPAYPDGIINNEFKGFRTDFIVSFNYEFSSSVINVTLNPYNKTIYFPAEEHLYSDGRDYLAYNLTGARNTTHVLVVSPGIRQINLCSDKTTNWIIFTNTEIRLNRPSVELNSLLIIKNLKFAGPPGEVFYGTEVYRMSRQPTTNNPKDFFDYSLAYTGRRRNLVINCAQAKRSHISFTSDCRQFTVNLENNSYVASGIDYRKIMNDSNSKRHFENLINDTENVDIMPIFNFYCIYNTVEKTFLPLFEKVNQKDVINNKTVIVMEENEDINFQEPSTLKDLLTFFQTEEQWRRAANLCRRELGASFGLPMYISKDTLLTRTTLDFTKILPLFPKLLEENYGIKIATVSPVYHIEVTSNTIVPIIKKVISTAYYNIIKKEFYYTILPDKNFGQPALLLPLQKHCYFQDEKGNLWKTNNNTHLIDTVYRTAVASNGRKTEIFPGIITIKDEIKHKDYPSQNEVGTISYIVACVTQDNSKAKEELDRLVLKDIILDFSGTYLRDSEGDSIIRFMENFYNLPNENDKRIKFKQALGGQLKNIFGDKVILGEDNPLELYQNYFSFNSAPDHILPWTNKDTITNVYTTFNSIIRLNIKTKTSKYNFWYFEEDFILIRIDPQLSDSSFFDIELSAISSNIVDGNLKTYYYFLNTSTKEAFIQTGNGLSGDTMVEFLDIENVIKIERTIAGEVLATTLSGEKYALYQDYEARNKLSLELERYGIKNYSIRFDLTVNAERVDLSGDTLARLNIPKLEYLPFRFFNVTEDFIIKGNRIASLEGCPVTVGGNCDVSYNQLTTFRGAPNLIGGIFNCLANHIISLDGIPKRVREFHYNTASVSYNTDIVADMVAEIKRRCNVTSGIVHAHRNQSLTALRNEDIISLQNDRISASPVFIRENRKRLVSLDKNWVSKNPKWWEEASELMKVRGAEDALEHRIVTIEKVDNINSLQGREVHLLNNKAFIPGLNIENSYNVKVIKINFATGLIWTFDKMRQVLYREEAVSYTLLEAAFDNMSQTLDSSIFKRPIQICRNIPIKNITYDEAEDIIWIISENGWKFKLQNDYAILIGDISLNFEKNAQSNNLEFVDKGMEVINNMARWNPEIIQINHPENNKNIVGWFIPATQTYCIIPQEYIKGNFEFSRLDSDKNRVYIINSDTQEEIKIDGLELKDLTQNPIFKLKNISNLLDYVKNYNFLLEK